VRAELSRAAAADKWLTAVGYKPFW
jgi:hypothetical protein